MANITIWVVFMLGAIPSVTLFLRYVPYNSTDPLVLKTAVVVGAVSSGVVGGIFSLGVLLAGG